MGKTISNFYIIIWLTYCVHWFTAGYWGWVDRLSNGLLLIAFLMSFVIIIYGYKRFGITKNLTKGYVPLLLMFVGYGLFHVAFGDRLYVGSGGKAINNASYTIGVLRTFLPIYAFYYLKKFKMINDSMLRKWFVVLIIFLVFLNSRVVFFRGTDEFTNNMGYNFVYLIPFVLLFRKKPVWMFVLLSVLLFLVVSCNKRGAILIAFLLTLYIIGSMVNLRTRRGRNTLIIASVFVVGLMLFTLTYLEKNEFLQNRIEMTLEGDDSGRSSIRRNIMNVMFGQSSFFRLLFGYGADGTLAIGSNYAHNDWLEIFVNNGFFGLVLFIFFWKSLYVSWKKMRVSPYLSTLFGCVFIICLASSLFSMFYSTIPFYLTMIWGYSFASLEKDRELVAGQV